MILEFSAVDVRQGENLEQYILNVTDDCAEQYGITLEIDNYEQRFAELVNKLHLKTGKKVVLLVDEYGKPILDNLLNDQLSEIRNVMNRFYAGVKSLDKHLKFVFITGVSKFAKVSVFSGMNHLRDISMDRRYATLCGVTQQELDSNFSQPINELANLEQLDLMQTLAKIKHWYNGYTFEENAPGVYNPFSLFRLFDTKKFGNYWFTTATPTFLLDLLPQRKYQLQNLTEQKVSAAVFQSSDAQTMEIHALLFQTGYLTIKDYTAPLYQLDFPNYAVKKTFYDSVAARYSTLGLSVSEGYAFQLTELLHAGNLDAFFKMLNVFFANIPYGITLQHEKYYQSLFYALFMLIGLSIEAEVQTNEVRIDCVVQTDDTVYIIEFKLNGSKEDALQQIYDKTMR